MSASNASLRPSGPRDSTPAVAEPQQRIARIADDQQQLPLSVSPPLSVDAAPPAQARSGGVHLKSMAS